jgi:UDP-N-acetyl-D-glucosamine dehydrogenase
MNLLSERGAEIEYHDSYVPAIKPTREHSHWVGKQSVPWRRKVIAGFDLVLIATNHASVNYKELALWAQCIVDTRNAMAGLKMNRRQVWKA